MTMREQLDNVAAAVGQRLERVFEDLERSPVPGLFGTVPDSVLLEQVRELTMRGGKRLRAALLAHGAGLFDVDAVGSVPVLDAAAALELLHTYFLIHDDIMDHDDTRRGGPSVHAALGKIEGDERRGLDLAVLAGDLASAAHQVMLSAVDVDPARRDRLVRLFATMHLDVVHGQTLDLAGRGPAEEVARRKTASYTVVGPLCAGAILGGASERDVAELADVAWPLGVAFQLRDDLLGVFGSEEQTGKPVGSDLRAGKHTLLVEEGLTRAAGERRAALEAVLGRGAPTDEQVAAARDALSACGAEAACRSRVDELVERFVEGLERGFAAGCSRQFLVEVARYIGRRSR